MAKKKSSRLLGWGMVIVGVLYILNFTAGFIELIPDNLPLLGNLDEGAFGALIWEGIKILREK